jgi:hypothetical protein
MVVNQEEETQVADGTEKEVEADKTFSGLDHLIDQLEEPAHCKWNVG